MSSKILCMIPLRVLYLFVLGITAFCAIGCDNDRISKLEKENQEMKSKLDKSNVVQEYDLQARCSKDARVWFNENWSRDKDTTLLDFTNHYNSKHNKCLIFVEFHCNSPHGDLILSSWTNDILLTDVYENTRYADFSQNHIVLGKPNYNLEEPVITCEVEGTKCKTLNEFSNLLRPYMND